MRCSIVKKILIIEDEEGVRISLSEILKMVNFEVHEAQNGVKGIEAAKAIIPDVIICDINMPLMDGFAVLHEINKDKQLKTIPFLFLTGKNEINDIRKGMEAGADDYLIKPFVASDVIKAIEVRLKKKESYSNNTGDSMETNKTEKLNRESNIILMVGTKPEKVKLLDINFIEAMEEYSNVFLVDNKKLIVKKLLKEWEETLPDNLFIRIHRSTIINLEHVLKFEKWFNNSYRVYMKNLSEPLLISRRYSIKLRNLIN